MTSPPFETGFDPAHGVAVPVGPDIQRITAANGGPFTFFGTNTYIVGRGCVAVIDPGPNLDSHRQALQTALGGREVSHVFVTHTHRDHSPLASRLASENGALTVAEGPHRPSRPLHSGEVNPFQESSDTDFIPDIPIADGAEIEGDGWALKALHTPGHTANHAVFVLTGPEENGGIVFSGDHVMAWASTVIAPPDGSMTDYKASLDRMLARDDRCYLPGHGGPVTEPRRFTRVLRSHRRMRETAVLDRLGKGDRTIVALVAAIYRDTDPRLHGAAGLSLLAHLEDLAARGLVETDGPPRLEGVYRRT